MLRTGSPHFFMWIFQDFSRSKLRFSRTVICGKKCCRSLYDHLSLQEKYSVIISYVFFKNFQDFSRTFAFFHFFHGLLQAWKFIFSFSRLSRFSRCVGTLIRMTWFKDAKENLNLFLQKENKNKIVKPL